MHADCLCGSTVIMGVLQMQIEELTSYENLDEESRRLVDIPDKDWNDWLAALEGDEEKGRDLSSLLGKRSGALQGEDEDENEDFNPISTRKLRGRGSQNTRQGVGPGMDDAGLLGGGGTGSRAKEATAASSARAAAPSALEKRLQQAEAQAMREGGEMADDLRKMKDMMESGKNQLQGRGGGRRKPGVARAAAAMRRRKHED